MVICDEGLLTNNVLTVMIAPSVYLMVVSSWENASPGEELRQDELKYVQFGLTVKAVKGYGLS